VIPDLTSALRTYLLNQRALTELTAERVIGGELPQSVIAGMPQACVVLALAGGLGTYGNGGQAYGDRRVDVRAYGATLHDAQQVSDVVYEILKFQLVRRVSEGCLIHWARQGSGPQPLRDPERDWPFVWSSWQVLASEVAVA